MNSMNEPAKLEDLLALFEDIVQPEDIMYSKVISQASKFITQERLRLEMSQKDFADHIHTKQSLISRWESGNYNFTLRKLAEIAVALDMDLHLYMTPRQMEKNINPFSDLMCTTWNYNIPRKIPRKTVSKPSFVYDCFNVNYTHKDLYSQTNSLSFSNLEIKEVLSC